MIRKAGLLAVLAPLSLMACAAAQSSPPAAAPPVAAVATSPRPQFGTFGFDSAGMDPAVRPGDDFYAHANGAWLKATEIPPDRTSQNTFNLVRETAQARTRTLIEDLANAPPSDAEARKIGDYYAAFMDEAAIEARGAAPLKAALDRIAAIHTRRDLARELGATLRADVDVLNATDLATERPFGLWVAEALNDTSRYRPYLLQGGLFLPDRAYYLSDAARYVALRADYSAHMARLFALAGMADGKARADRVLALETAIARTHWTPVETTDVEKANVVWTRGEFATKAPGLDWPTFLDAAGLADEPEFGAWQASAITGFARLVESQPLETWRDYLAFHAIERAAPLLSRAFVDENFAFHGKTLGGTLQLTERWKRGVDQTSEALGEAVGKLYVQRHFTPQAKAQVETMVKNILAAFDQRIDRIAWMSPATRARAHEKLANFQVGVGYPGAWRDYSDLLIARDDAYGNWERASLFEYRRNLAKLRRPVDRGEWFMTPQTVNALYAPSQNSIIFPAAILAPPFFDPAADPAVNYGAIGGIIGHEISHGFDNTGALFDAKGNVRNWWTPEDFAHFTASAKALAAQYSAYQALPDLAVNGDLTLGENIADLAGLAVAYDAYRISLGGTAASVLDGLTGDQRLFLGWAQNYRSKYRDDTLRRVIMTDVHSPGPYRAATVRNLDAWYDAFGVKPQDKLYLAPSERVRVW